MIASSSHLRDRAYSVERAGANDASLSVRWKNCVVTYD